jgi:hypothetical protein
MDVAEVKVKEGKWGRRPRLGVLFASMTWVLRGPHIDGSIFYTGRDALKGRHSKVYAARVRLGETSTRGA